MKKLLHSNWTSVTKKWMDTLSGKKCSKKKKQVELYAVCDKSISFIIDIDE